MSEDRDDKIQVSRHWLVSVMNAFRGDLPRGPVGDAAFLIRGQIKDMLNRPTPERTRG